MVVAKLGMGVIIIILIFVKGGDWNYFYFKEEKRKGLTINVLFSIYQLLFWIKT